MGGVGGWETWVVSTARHTAERISPPGPLDWVDKTENLFYSTAVVPDGGADTEDRRADDGADSG